MPGSTNSQIVSKIFNQNGSEKDCIHLNQKSTYVTEVRGIQPVVSLLREAQVSVSSIVYDFHQNIIFKVLSF